MIQNRYTALERLDDFAASHPGILEVSMRELDIGNRFTAIGSLSRSDYVGFEIQEFVVKPANLHTKVVQLFNGYLDCHWISLSIIAAPHCALVAVELHLPSATYLPGFWIVDQPQR
jgi:hypothetical protein